MTLNFCEMIHIQVPTDADFVATTSDCKNHRLTMSGNKRSKLRGMNPKRFKYS